MLDNYSGNYIANSVKIGAVLYMTDVVLRPRFEGDMMEVLLFGIQGWIVAYIYNTSQKDCDDEADPPVCHTQDVTLMQAAAAGFTCYVTNLLIGTLRFEGLANEIIKFGIQGMLVNMVLTFNYYQ